MSDTDLETGNILNEFYRRLRLGLYNDAIKDIEQELRWQKEVIRGQHILDLKKTIRPGSKVKLQNLRPKRINGTIVEVIEVKQTRFTAKVDGRTTSVPLACAVLVP